MFDVRKPYFALDPAKVFRELGEVRNRGIEVSLAGQITPRLSIVLGAVFLDATVSGEEVELGLIGTRPVGTIGRTINGALNWDVPWVKGLSLDVSYEGVVRPDRQCRQHASIIPGTLRRRRSAAATGSTCSASRPPSARRSRR